METEAAYYAGAKQTGTLEKNAPLTMDLGDRQDHAISTIGEITSRLYLLKDRIFGAEPAATAPSPVGVGNSPGFSCAADALSSKARRINSMLSDLDDLSADLANRL